MDSNSKSLVPSLANRIQDHFDQEDPEEVVRRSQQLMLYPNEGEQQVDLATVPGPVLVHPRPKRVPPSAYLAPALTGVSKIENPPTIPLSHLSSIICPPLCIHMT